MLAASGNCCNRRHCARDQLDDSSSDEFGLINVLETALLPLYHSGDSRSRDPVKLPKRIDAHDWTQRVSGRSLLHPASAPPTVSIGGVASVVHCKRHHVSNDHEAH